MYLHALRDKQDVLNMPDVARSHFYVQSGFRGDPYTEQSKDKENSSRTLKRPLSFLQVQTIKSTYQRLECNGDESKENPTLRQKVVIRTLCIWCPSPQTASLSPVSHHPRHQRLGTVQHGDCEKRRLKGACLERRDFSQEFLNNKLASILDK